VKVGTVTVAAVALSVSITAALGLGLRARRVLDAESTAASRLNELARAERSVVPAMLAVRSGASPSYDALAPLVRTLRQTRELTTGSADAEKLRREVEEQERQIELFKTNVALFRVSTLAFPAVFERAPEGTLGPAASSLRAEVLRYVALPGRDRADRLRAGVLAATATKSPESADDPTGAVLAGHVRSLLEHGERADQIIRTFTEKDLATGFERVGVEHDRRARRALVVAVGAASAAVFLALLLCALALEVALSRRRSG
jgi:hypothetical protein